jgi:hypothetical protein
VIETYASGPLEHVPEDVQACWPTQGPLHRYLAWATKTTDAEPWFHLGAILPCWSHQCCIRGFRVDAERDLTPQLWSFIVGAPASSKSTSMRRAMGMYRTLQIEHAFTDPFVMAEGSVPGLFEALTERWNPDLGCTEGIVFRDEAARLLDTKDSVSDMLCQIMDGDSVQRHLRGLRRAKKEGEQVQDTLRDPAYSGILATTFARLREVTKASFLEGGLYSRFLWFVGAPRPGRQSLMMRPHREEETQVRAAWSDWGRWALGQQTLGEDLTVRVPDDAIECLRVTLFSNLEAAAKQDNRLNAARKRGIEKAIILAGLFALSQYRLHVTFDDMDRAVNLVESCLRGFERLDPTLAVDDLMVAVDVAFHAIAGSGDLGLKRSDLYKILRKPKGVIDHVVDTLADEGSIHTRVHKKPGAGRNPTFLVSNGPERYAGDPPDEPEPKATVVPIRRT